ncbi:MAG: MFS transporter, partial [Chloroflexota bacterium]|nr:MFS transporter [Chloroflexota bacterium]
MQQAVIVRTARHPFVEVLALKDFSLLCLGDIVSSLGDQFTYIAMALLVLKTTGSAMQVGIMLIMTAVPNILLGLIAGVFVDRWDRRRTMIVCDLLRGGVIAAIPWLIHIHLALAYTAIFISTAADRFESSARVASIPHLVPKERMVSANAFKSTGVQAGQMIGFSLAGLMVGLYGTTVAFYFD